MNEDVVQPGEGFGMHAHQDMEIITYVLSGELEHHDSLGHRAVLRAGEFQRMTAGTGISHSEFNPSSTEPVHLYQIWLFPARKGLAPSYEQKGFPESERRNQLRLAASPDAAHGSLNIHQDARIFLALFDEGRAVTHLLADGRHAWLQVLRGDIALNGVPLHVGDGAAVSEERQLTIRAENDAEILLLDLA
jgi:redox-sensitive bicupin YhaK (pirin superfamily)